MDNGGDGSKKEGKIEDIGEDDAGGEGRGRATPVDNRDEASGISLGPVAHGHLVGVRCKNCELSASFETPCLI